MKKRFDPRPLLIAAVLCAARAGALWAGGEAAAWKFVVTGDSRGSDNGVNAPVLKELVEAIKAEAPAFVLFPGDMVHGARDHRIFASQLRYWRDIFVDPLDAAGIKVYAVRGNHEITADGQSRRAWDEVFSGPYALPANGPDGEKNRTYSFSFRNAFIAGIDLYEKDRRIDQDWLNGQFAANELPHVFVFAHEPVYRARAASPGDRGLDERDRFVRSILAEGGVSYFCGDYHWYDHAAVAVEGEARPFHQLVVGTAGAPLRRWGGDYPEENVSNIAHFRNYGYLVVEIRGTTATFTAKERTGENTYRVADVFSYDCADGKSFPTATER